jgi:hypothetical protein
MTEQDFKEKYRKTLIIKKSPVDSRTLKASRVLPLITLPIKTNNVEFELPVKDQGELPICAGCAGAADQELMDVFDIGLDEPLSPMFLYNNRANTSQDGMDNLDLMKIRQKKGVCLERLYPIGSTEESSPEAKVDALNHRIGLYAEVDTQQALNTVLASRRSVTMAVCVYNFTERFWHKRPGDPEDGYGGHDVKVVDYNDETRKRLVKNSWGESFGRNGYVEMDYDDFNDAWEYWAAVDLPSVKPNPDPIPDPQPEPEPKKKSWFKRNLWWMITVAVIIGLSLFVLTKNRI